MLREMKARAKEAWWLVMLAGVASVLFGLAVILLPSVSAALLIALFTGLLLVEGITELIYGLSATKEDRTWWLSVLLGVLLLAAAVYFAVNPAFALVTFALLAGWVLVFRGTFELAFGLSPAGGRAGYILGGFVGIIAGVIILLAPIQGAAALMWVLGLYALVRGVTVIAGAMAVRSTYREALRRRSELLAQW